MRTIKEIFDDVGYVAGKLGWNNYDSLLCFCDSSNIGAIAALNDNIFFVGDLFVSCSAAGTSAADYLTLTFPVQAIFPTVSDKYFCPQLFTSPKVEGVFFKSAVITGANIASVFCRGYIVNKLS